MNTKEFGKQTVILSGFPLTINVRDLNETARLWIQDIVSGENKRKNYFFVKMKFDDTMIFYTEDGVSFAQERQELPAEMHWDEHFVGVIMGHEEKNTEVVELKVRLFANPKEDETDTADLAKFRKEMIEKYG